MSRNVTVAGRRISVRLEPEMWQALADAARRERCSIHDVCSMIADGKKREASLTAAIRVFLLQYFRSAATEDGHARAGHGPGKTLSFVGINALPQNALLPQGKNQVAVRA